MTSTIDAPTTTAPRPGTDPNPDLDLAVLRGRVEGVLATPSDPEYAGLVSPWNLAEAMTPAAVLAPRTAQDVVEAVRFARANGFTVGVQATGHGARSGLAGHLLVATASLDELTVHAAGWARVGAGVKWRRVIDAAAPYGLAPLNGSSSDVGVVGYITGGGVGPMSRTFGIASDLVRAFDVVTGDGELRRVTAATNPDLFFALRGGKSAAGIITAVEIDLVPLTSFYGGAVYFDGAHARTVIERYRTWATALPTAATTSFVLFQLPPLPEVPEPLQSKLTIGVRFLWTGDADEGRALLAELTSVAPVLLDDVALRPYTEVDAVHADPVDPMPVHDPGVLLGEFPAAAAEVLLALAGEGSGSPQVLVEMRHLGGAYARPPAVPDAFCHRDARYSVLAVGIPGTGAEEHAERLLGALAPWATGGAWPNFVPPHDGDTATGAYTPAVLARLRRVAAAYDPDGVLASATWTR